MVAMSKVGGADAGVVRPVIDFFDAEAAGSERLAELRDVDLNALYGLRGRAAVPEVLDQAIARDDLVGVQEEQREQPPLLGGAERDRTTLVDDLERPEDAELQRPRSR